MRYKPGKAPQKKDETVWLGLCPDAVIEARGKQPDIKCHLL